MMKDLPLYVSALIIYLIVYLALSLIIMGLWNGPVMNAFAPGAIQKISYSTALGLTFFLMLIMPMNVVILDKTGLKTSQIQN